MKAKEQLHTDWHENVILFSEVMEKDSISKAHYTNISSVTSLSMEVANTHLVPELSSRMQLSRITNVDEDPLAVLHSSGQTKAFLGHFEVMAMMMRMFSSLLSTIERSELVELHVVLVAVFAFCCRSVGAESDRVNEKRVG